MFEKSKSCTYRKSNIMVVAVATLAFSVGINSTANAEPVYINDYNGLMAINQHIIDGVDDENEYFLNSNIELPSLDVVAEQARTYIEGIFRGVFDGQGHTLSNLNAPLFDVIGEAIYPNGAIPDSWVSGSVRNLGLKTGEAGIIGDAGGDKVGVLAGELGAYSTVDRVGVSGSISTNAGDTAGGLVGVAGYGTTISNSHSLVSIDSAGQGTVIGVAGGLVGALNYGTISNSTSTGSVSTTSGYAAVGGLVGVFQGVYGGSILNSSSSGDVTISGNEEQLFQGAVGGLVGAVVGGTVYNSSASGDVTSTGNSTNTNNFQAGTGGLVGVSGYGAAIENSTASGDVSSQSSFTGGLIGLVDSGSIVGNSASGSVTVAIGETFYEIPAPGNPVGIDPPLVELMIESVGGLVGYSSSPIYNSNASGAVTVSSSVSSAAEIRYVGGLVGEVYGVLNSIASGPVSAISGDSRVRGIGGLAGIVWTDIYTSQANGYVYGSGDDSTEIGGLVGSIEFDVYNSSALGDVEVDGANSSRVGGLVGYGRAIYNSSAAGDVTALDGDLVGGLAGDLNAIYNSVADGLSVGRVGADVGLLAGYVDSYLYDSVYLPDPEEQELAAAGEQQNEITFGDGIANPQGLIDGVGPNAETGPTDPEILEGAELLNYDSETSAWGENPYVNSGRPYILALREFGFYSDATPKQMKALLGYVNLNPKFSLADSTILRLFLYLAGDDTIVITVEDFEVLGVIGVNEKNLPVILKLLKEVDMLTLDLKVINKNVKIADELLKKKKKKK